MQKAKIPTKNGVIHNTSEVQKKMQKINEREAHNEDEQPPLKKKNRYISQDGKGAIKFHFSE